MEHRFSSSFHDSRDKRRSSGRFTHAMPELSFSSHGPLPIASRKIMNTAPPPLPPPARIHDLEIGYDAGWQHGNSRSPTSLPPINPGSSLLGDHRRSGSETASQGDPMQIDEVEGRQSGVPISRSPETQITIDPPPPATDGFPNAMPGIPNPAGSM
jgi:hypothetical protein